MWQKNKKDTEKLSHIFNHFSYDKRRKTRFNDFSEAESFFDSGMRLNQTFEGYPKVSKSQQSLVQYYIIYFGTDEFEELKDLTLNLRDKNIKRCYREKYTGRSDNTAQNTF